MNIFLYQEILDKISKHCPESLSAYIQCLNRMDADRTFFFSKSFIDVEMSEDFRTFRNNIKKLARENLLEWHPFDGGISVTLAEIE